MWKTTFVTEYFYLWKWLCNISRLLQLSLDRRVKCQYMSSAVLWSTFHCPYLPLVKLSLSIIIYVWCILYQNHATNYTYTETFYFTLVTQTCQWPDKCTLCIPPTPKCFHSDVCSNYQAAVTEWGHMCIVISVLSSTSPSSFVITRLRRN